MDPNLFLPKCKQQYPDKVTGVETPWVLVGVSKENFKAYLVNPLLGIFSLTLSWFEIRGIIQFNFTWIISYDIQ